MRAYAVLLAHHYAMEYFSVSVRYIVHVDMIVSRPAAYSRVAPRRTQDTYDTSACSCERMGGHIDKNERAVCNGRGRDPRHALAKRRTKGERGLARRKRPKE